MFNCSLHVLWCRQICFCICSQTGTLVTCTGHLIFLGHSPLYPSLASTHSLCSNWWIKPSWKIERSFQSSSGMYWPLIHTMSKVKMDAATLYCSVGPLNLCEYHALFILPLGHFTYGDQWTGSFLFACRTACKFYWPWPTPWPDWNEQRIPFAC
jgi:hypothetical protein